VGGTLLFISDDTSLLGEMRKRNFVMFIWLLLYVAVSIDYYIAAVVVVVDEVYFFTF